MLALHRNHSHPSLLSPPYPMKRHSGNAEPRMERLPLAVNHEFTRI